MNRWHSLSSVCFRLYSSRLSCILLMTKWVIRNQTLLIFYERKDTRHMMESVSQEFVVIYYMNIQLQYMEIWKSKMVDRYDSTTKLLKNRFLKDIGALCHICVCMGVCVVKGDKFILLYLLWLIFSFTDTPTEGKMPYHILSRHYQWIL